MEDNIYSIDTIYAIIVLYKYDLESSATVQSLNKSLERSGLSLDLLVYDNNPKHERGEKTFRFGNFNVHYIYDPSNPGIGKAYNTGAAIASQKGKKWFLLLDEDTVFPVDGMDKYIQAVNTYQDQSLFAPVLKAGEIIISPSRYRWKRGFPVKSIDKGVHCLKTYSPINSGMLVEAGLFGLSGGYHNQIKLDFSDFYFIDKLKKHIRQFVVIDLVMEHSLSSVSEKKELSVMLNRFIHYCTGAKYSAAEDIKSFPVFFAIVFLRAVKLGLSFRSFRFVGIFFKHFLT